MKFVATIGTVILLRKILPTDGWYRNESRKGKILVAAVDALDALPESDIQRGSEEGDREWEARRDAAWNEEATWEWDEAQEEAVRVCVKFYREQAALAPVPFVRSLLKLLSLDKD